MGIFSKSVQNREKQEGMIRKKRISTKREKKTNIALFFYCRVKERTYFWNWQNYHTRQKEKKKTTLIDVRLINRSLGIYRSKTILTPVASKSDIISTDHILSVTKISIYSLVEKKKLEERPMGNSSVEVTPFNMYLQIWLSALLTSK